VLHSRYLSGSASGENRVVDDEVRLLRDAGHRVEVWDPTPGEIRGIGAVKAGLSAVWSREASAKVREMVHAHRPDLVHLHNLFPMLSPAVIRAARTTAIVMTLHNYRLMCLPGLLLREGRICEDCVGRIPWAGVVHRCYRGSVLGSGALATSLGGHRLLRTFESVTRYVAISRFVKEKHVEAGLRPSSIRVKPHFAWPGTRRKGPGRYFLYVGRVSPEKGVETIVTAWKPTFCELRIVGDGPDISRLAALAPPNVRFIGTVAPTVVSSMMAGARALLVPSSCYEGAGKVVLEAYAAGVPTLASRIGGLPEVIEDTVTGYLLPPKDGDAWARGVERLMDDGDSQRLGAAAFELWRRRYSPERGLSGLEDCYAEALGARVG
jgi:glycosyltransferase involved in cell wall biosynthesis